MFVLDYMLHFKCKQKQRELLWIGLEPPHSSLLRYKSKKQELFVPANYDAENTIN